ncbi:MAG: FAD-dependent monooxygenase [Myxococcota bacterium]
MAGPVGSVETEVAIVGGGPVGLCLAVELGARGVPCAVLERSERGAPAFPTANHIGVRSMEHLRRLGLAGEVADAFRPRWGGERGGDWVAVCFLGGPEVARVEDALAGSRPRSDSPEREVWAPKPCFDPVLARAAEAAPGVRILHGLRVTSAETQEGRVRGRARDADGGEVDIDAAWLVACDGAGSTVRRACGIEQVGPPPLPVVVHSAFFRSRRLADLAPEGGVQVSILGTPEGPTPTPFGAGLMVSVDGHDLWRLHGPGLDADDPAKSRARLRELGADDAEILAMSAWTPAQALSTRYRSGRIFLAGDAAHAVTPFGGLGVNTGMADAFDLGWKLAATREGWGGPRLLGESYAYERRLAALDLLRYQGVVFQGDDAVRLGPPLPLYTPPDASLWAPGSDGDAARRAYGEGLVASRGDEYEKPAIDLGYRYDGSPIVCDDGSPAPDRSDARVYRQTARPGGRAPHVALGKGRSTLDLFGAGFTLLRTDAAVDVGPLEDAARRVGLPLRVETVPEAADAYERALTLVRPDGFVAWRGAAPPADAAAVVDRVRGAG